MEKFNLIISFANQKGGVGKSTLCTLFADYAASLGYPVRVVDCDLQSSIAQLRKKELEPSQPEDGLTPSEPPYHIAVHYLKDRDTTLKLISELVSFNGIVLIDTPGNLNEPGIVPVLANSDYIVCPFTFDKMSVTSTAIFILLVNRLKSTLGSSFKTKTVYVPNRVDGRVGTKAEKKLYSATKLHLSHYGEIAPEVGLRACMQRLSTLGIEADQKEVVNDAFSFILSLMQLPEASSLTVSSTDDNNKDND